MLLIFHVVRDRVVIFVNNTTTNTTHATYYGEGVVT